VRSHRGVSLGRRPGSHWQRDRFRHPYLRESLLDLGYATDTLETAATWSSAAHLRETVAASAHAYGAAVLTRCEAVEAVHDGSGRAAGLVIRDLDNPRPTADEVDYLLRAAVTAFPGRGIDRSAVRGTFAGLRPILDIHADDPSEASREEDIWEENGVLTVSGGKLTPTSVLSFEF